MANKAFKYRIYPTASQRELLLKTFGCCRFVYNHYLVLQSERHTAGETYMSRTACNNDCNRILKETHPWLREVDKFALTNAVYALNRGFQRFFQHQGGYPRFKSRRHGRMSYTTNFTNENIAVLEQEIKLPKLGRVCAVVHRQADAAWVLKQATVSMERDGSFYVSILYEYKTDIVKSEVNPSSILGLDYKSDGLYMDSEGNCCDMPHFYRDSQKKLSKAQRKLKHKKLRSNNYYRQQRRISRISRKIANQRKDFLHKVSTGIANRYDLVCIEDLNLRNLSNKGFGNGKATLDNGYGMFATMLGYKLADRGKQLVQVDKWYPSSKTCSRCGKIKLMPLSQRSYDCTCGLKLDRDVNAAVNIKNRGYEMYLEKCA